jgi:hypothetical protein
MRTISIPATTSRCTVARPSWTRLRSWGSNPWARTSRSSVTPYGMLASGPVQGVSLLRLGCRGGTAYVWNQLTVGRRRHGDIGYLRYCCECVALARASWRGRQVSKLTIAANKSMPHLRILTSSSCDDDIREIVEKLSHTTRNPMPPRRFASVERASIARSTRRVRDAKYRALAGECSIVSNFQRKRRPAKAAFRVLRCEFGAVFCAGPPGKVPDLRLADPRHPAAVARLRVLTWPLSRWRHRR